METNEPKELDQEALDLGIAMGERRVLGMIAGRCSAAQAATLLKIREEKAYAKYNLTWDEYCQRYLKISSRTADRTILIFKKHGPIYFETAAHRNLARAV